MPNPSVCMRTLHKEKKKEIIWFGNVCIKFYTSVHTPATKLVDVNLLTLKVNIYKTTIVHPYNLVSCLV
jgi:hypothetical protein